MSVKLSKIFSIILVLSLLMPLAVFGGEADIAKESGELPERADPNNLQPTELQFTPVGEVQGSRVGLYRYLVILDDPAVPTYTGGIAGLQGTSLAVSGGAKLDINSPAVKTYVNYLSEKQNSVLNTAQQRLGRLLDVQHRYAFALNGFSTRLTNAEATKFAELPGVKAVQIDMAFKPDTDVSPEWVGATDVWDGIGGGQGVMGEGIVVGIVDTGINMTHTSFEAEGDDGYVHINPFGDAVYVGWCDPVNSNYKPSYKCNNKLIGAWDYADASWGENDGPWDHHSHGSHTASTVAGNIIDEAEIVAPTASHTDQISGMAPHANIIAYDVCGDSCYDTDVVAAVNQAIIDGVDVINESIGIGGDPFTSNKALAYLNAVAAGIFYARSAGNEGPGAGTVGPEPAWTFSTAALTHPRKFMNSLVSMSGGTTPPDDLFGEGLTSGYGPAPIVFAGDYTETLKIGADAEDARLCGMGEAESYPSPWEAGTFNGEIVVCDRGYYARVEKGSNVLDAGAGGFVLADDGNGIVGDAHYLPGLHISQTDGSTLKAWLDPTVVQTATITGFWMEYPVDSGDIMAGFSSRGPSEYDMLKPDGGAPGVSIWAAYKDQDETGLMSGTSMASPHIAGMAALLKALHPTWSPSEIKSALMTTATRENTLKEDGSTPTDPFDVGAGRAQVNVAGAAGLLFDESSANFGAANADNASELNVASFAEMECYQSCSWTRTAWNASQWSVTFTALIEEPAGVDLSLDQSVFTLDPGEVMTFTLTADTIEAVQNTWLFGSLTWQSNHVNVPDAYMPLAIHPTSSTDLNLVTKDASGATVDGLGTVVYTLTLANPGSEVMTYTLTDVVPENAQYISGSAWGGLVYDGGTEALTYEGTFDPAVISLIEEKPPYWYGYVPLSDFFDPFGFPSNADEGGWLISGLDFWYLGEHYTDAIWSVNGTFEAGTASMSSSGFTNYPVPYPDDGINNLLAPWWADINFEDGGQLYAGTLDDGYYLYDIFEWQAAPEYGTSGTVTATFQIWMIPGTSAIWFVYPENAIDPSWYWGGTVGIENKSGTAGDQYYISSPDLSIDPTGTFPEGPMELWVDFVGEPPVEMGFSVLATGPSGANILNEAVVMDQHDNPDSAWVNTKINPWELLQFWFPSIFK